MKPTLANELKKLQNNLQDLVKESPSKGMEKIEDKNPSPLPNNIYSTKNSFWKIKKSPDNELESLLPTESTPLLINRKK